MAITADAKDLIVTVLAQLDESSFDKEYEALKKTLINNPIIQDLTIDTSKTRQAVKDVASEIHNEMARAFEKNGVSFDITVKDIERMLLSSYNTMRKQEKQLEKERQAAAKAERKNIADNIKQETEYQRLRAQYKKIGDAQSVDAESLRQSMAYYEQERSYQEQRAKYLAEGKLQQDAFDKEVKESAEYYKQFANEAEKAYGKFQKASEKAKEVIASMNGTGKVSYANQTDSLVRTYQSMGIASDEVKLKVDALTQAQTNLQAVINSSAYTSEEAKTRAIIQADKEYTIAVNEVTNALNAQRIASTGLVSDQSRLTLANSMEKWLLSNTKAAKTYGDRIKQLITQLRNLDVEMTKADMSSTRMDYGSMQTDAAAQGLLGFSTWDKFKNAVQKFGGWSLVTGSIMRIVYGFRQMIENVEELDNSLLELQKVSDLTADGLDEITERAYELGEAVGKTGTQVLDAITTFKRAGFELEESVDLAEIALKMTNVAEGIDDAADSAQYLISIMKGYGDTSEEFAQHILDSINQVSNTQAIDFDNLADGAQRLSAVANQAGVSIEQMLGMITGGYEVLGNVEKTSAGLITILTRLQSIQLSDEEDVDSVAKLQKTMSVATNGVVNIVDQTTGQLRDAYDILSDINGVWDTLDRNTQEGIAFAAGGTRQKSVFLSIMENWESVERSIVSATDSAGSSEEENSRYLDSISGKLSQLESAFEQLSATVIDSDLIKFFVDFGTVAVKGIDGLVGALGGLVPILSGTVGSFLLSKRGLDYSQEYTRKIILHGSSKSYCYG